MITLSSRTQSGTGEDGIGDEKYSADTKSNGIDCEDEDIVLSPGFDAIQAFAGTNRFENMDHRTLYKQSPTTPRPHPISR
jgi:hypothetical protein